ncbi:MAG: PD-(D/E)XK nuclease family protein [Chloroflexi bacterium]|nr:PD-(D/E)XK nuclease family protein [Chloroflexota bacterium]
MVDSKRVAIDRNIFNQYPEAQTENRVTHALAHAVASSQRLTDDFVVFLLNRDCPRGCSIKEQKSGVKLAPAAPNGNVAGAGRTIPDLWIYNEEEGFTCVIENKITAPLETQQLVEHGRGAKKEFTNANVVALTPDGREDDHRAVAGAEKEGCPVVWRKWPEVYSWLMNRAASHNKESSLAKKESWLVEQFCEFLQLTEEQLLESKSMEGTITKFCGIPFGKDTPYEEVQAKNLLRRLTQFLRRSEELKNANAYPNMESEPSGRIAAWENGACDFIKLESGVTNKVNCLHITVVITAAQVDFQLTVPNAVGNKTYWHRVMDAKLDDWQKMLGEIVRNASELTKSPNQKRPKGPQPHLRILQRHFDHQGADAIDDGVLFFALGAVAGGAPGVKVVPAWINILPGLISQVRAVRANTQLDVGISYIYREYKEWDAILKRPDFKEEAVKACLALKPFYDFLQAPGVPAD